MTTRPSRLTAGDLYTLTTTATYALNPKTSLSAGYVFSYANYGQNNAVAGLPLGIDFARDEVILGLTRERSPSGCPARCTTNFPNIPNRPSGNANNFTAQGVFATLVL